MTTTNFTGALVALVALLCAETAQAGLTRAAQAAQGITGQESSGLSRDFQRGNTPEQVIRAEAYAARAFNLCSYTSRNAQREEMIDGAAQQNSDIIVGGIITWGMGEIFGKDNVPRYRGTSGSVRRQQQSRPRDCAREAQKAYRDMLAARPASFCESERVRTVAVGGTTTSGGQMTERCQATTQDQSWTNDFRPAGN